jgi:hypothetical protein
MPTAFDMQFAAAFRGMLATHGETVTYLPDEGRSREITALVTRRELQPMPPVRSGIAPLLMLEVLDDPEDEDYGGIDPARVKAGADKFRIAWEQGGKLEDRLVLRRIPSDGGVVRLEIR